MLSPWRHRKTHEAAFLERYPHLLARARRLATAEVSAEDLVHDAFVQFTLQQPDLDAIDNLDAYLFVLLRNLYVSSVRRQSSIALSRRASTDVGSEALALAAVDRAPHLDAVEELALICRYACVRRFTSRAASCLILRFFHSYSPFEIAQLARCPVKTIDDQLHRARREAQQQRHDVSGHSGSLPALPIVDTGSSTDAIITFREYIFRTSHPPCPDAGRTGDPPRSTEELAHLVGCRQCLERESRTLSIRPPDERPPDDSIARGSRSCAGERGRRADTTSRRPDARRWYESLRQRQRAEPSELQIAVNGVIVGAHANAGVKTEARISVRVAEPLAFVEILDQDGARLLLLSADPFPAGDIEQEAGAVFSHGGSLRLTLSFRELWPTLGMLYEGAPAAGAQRERHAAAHAEGGPVLRFPSSAGDTGWLQSLSAAVRRMRATTGSLWRPAHRDTVLRPGLHKVGRAGAWTMALVVLALGATALVDQQATYASAGAVLERTAAHEGRSARQPEVAIQRHLLLEERTLPDRRVTARHRIERWSSEGGTRTARRLYDGDQKLVAGQWLDRSIEVAEQTAARDATTTERLWTLEPSAAVFATLAQTDEISLDEHDDVYVLSWHAGADRAGVVSAALRVDKRLGRAVEHTLIVRTREESRELRFTEVSFSEVPTDVVDPRLFEPEATPADDSSGADPDQEDRQLTTLPSAKPTGRPNHAEIDAWLALHAARLRFGPEADIRHTETGELLVSVTVVDPGRADALRVLLAHAPALRTATLDIRSTPHPSVAVASGLSAAELAMLPSYRRLHEHFARGVDAGVADGLVAAFAQGMAAEANRATRALSSLQVFVERWPARRARMLPLDEAARWQTILRDHIEEIGRSAREMQKGLEAIAPVAGVAWPSATVMDFDDLEPAIDELSAAVRQQHELTRAFFQPEGRSREVATEELANLVRLYSRTGALTDAMAGPWSIHGDAAGRRTAPTSDPHPAPSR